MIYLKLIVIPSDPLTCVSTIFLYLRFFIHKLELGTFAHCNSDIEQRILTEEETICESRLCGRQREVIEMNILNVTDVQKFITIQFNWMDGCTHKRMKEY